jgi:uncharacterized membrane protein
LNAFFLGLLVMHHFRHDTGRLWRRGQAMQEFHGPRRGIDGGRSGPAEAPLLRELVRAAGGPHDPRIREVLRHGREAMQTHRQRVRTAQESVRTAAARLPYDELALRQALTRLGAEGASAQAEAQQVMLRLAAQLSAEERRRLTGPASSARADE